MVINQHPPTNKQELSNMVEGNTPLVITMGQNSVPPVNIPIPTKIGSKMGGEFTNPNQNGIPLVTRSHMGSTKPRGTVRRSRASLGLVEAPDGRAFGAPLLRPRLQLAAEQRAEPRAGAQPLLFSAKSAEPGSKCFTVSGFFLGKSEHPSKMHQSVLGQYKLVFVVFFDLVEHAVVGVLEMT